MALNLRQFAALVLAGAICLGSAGATGAQSLPETPATEVSVESPVADPVVTPEEDLTSEQSTADAPVADPTEELESEVLPEEPAVGFGTNPVDEELIPDGPVDDFVPDFELDPDDLPGIYDPYAGIKLRVGLAYPGNSNGALIHANLLNAEMSAVTGYRFGFYDDALEFVLLASTQETALSMVKTTNIYRVGENYYDAKPSGDYELLGCYHRQLPFAFAT